MPQPGFFVLHPAVLPPLTADRYTLHGTIEDMPHGPIDPIDAQIVVSAPRFTMPPEQILSTFPPANRAGAFQDTLPQIVLQRRTLPWERRLDPADEQLPWLALVVIAEGEGSLSGESKVEDCVTPGVALPHPEDRDTATSVYLTVTQTVVNGVFPTKDDARLLAHVREVDVADSELMGGDDDGFVAVVIANRLPQPGFDDQGNPVPKKYLACLVNLEGQAAVLPPPPPDPINFHFLATDVVQDLTLASAAYIDHPDRFVMGPTQSPPQQTEAIAARTQTRPDTAKAAVRTGAAWAKDPAAIEAAAVSASAEHAPSLVRGAMASGWQIPVIVFEPTYRFPVLAHWSFTVSGDPTFEELMKGLDVGLIGTLIGDVPPKTPAEIEKEKHRAPPPASPRPDPELAETGHVGLPHQTRRGDHVRAWFRGPACAHPTVREQADKAGRLPLAHTSDQLRIVVPDGREDVSLAAAFEIGRLLALSQPAVVNALMRWRREQFGAQRAAELAAEALIPILGGLLDHRQPGLGALVGRQVVLATAQQPDKVLAPARPLVDPGRPLTYARGDLNALIANGLGFSLDQVTKVAQRIGIVAALADAPVASTDQREPALTGPAFAALQSDLDGAVTSIAADVLKSAPTPAPAEVAPRRRRTKDALDRLLESQETT
jgi:hypothetical protein